VNYVTNYFKIILISELGFSISDLATTSLRGAKQSLNFAYLLGMAHTYRAEVALSLRSAQ
jgi:hypothetical protein